MAIRVWAEMGCDYCRWAWLSGTSLPELAVYELGQSELYQCPRCKAYWERYDRGAYEVTTDYARKFYPQAFLNED